MHHYLKQLSQTHEKYKRNVFYKGALSLNSLPVIERNLPHFDKFKDIQKKKLSLKLNEPPVV